MARQTLVATLAGVLQDHLNGRRPLPVAPPSLRAGNALEEPVQVALQLPAGDLGRLQEQAASQGLSLATAVNRIAMAWIRKQQTHAVSGALRTDAAGDQRVAVLVRMPGQLHRRLQARALDDGVSMATAIERLARDYVDGRLPLPQ